MEVQIDSSSCEEDLRKVAFALYPVFVELNSRLKGEYGGVMENLLIHLELVERWSNADGTPRHPFRFQKRVSGRSRFGLPSIPDKFKVGHFSVRPDYSRIRHLPTEQSIPYVLSLIYRESETLVAKQKKLGGFNAKLFMGAFRDACKSMGYEIEA